MRQRQVTRSLIASFAVASLAMGCTSLLGDFSTSGASGSSGDAAKDAAMDAATDGAVDDGALGDGGAADGAGDGGNYALKCDSLMPTGNTQVATLPALGPGMGHRYLQMVTVSDSVVHIIVDDQSPNSPSQYFIGNPQDARQPWGATSLGNAQPQQFSGSADGASLLALVYGDAGPALSVFDVPSAQSPQQSLPAPTSLGMPNLINSNRFSAGFLTVAPNDYLYAYTVQPGDAGSDLYIGRGSGPNAVAALAASPVMSGASPVLLHAGKSLYVYLSSDPKYGGAQAYKLSDNGQVVTQATGRPLDVSATALMVSASPSVLPGRYNFGLIQLDTSSTTALATFRVGSVDGAQLDTFVAEDLVKGVVVDDSASLPINNGGQGWYGDEYVMYGTGQPQTMQGFNFVWHDAQGHLRANNVGPTAILANDPNKIGSVAMSLSQQLGTRYVAWNVAWTEPIPPSASAPPSDALYFGQLVCHGSRIRAPPPALCATESRRAARSNAQTLKR